MRLCACTGPMVPMDMPLCVCGLSDVGKKDTRVAASRQVRQLSKRVSRMCARCKLGMLQDLFVLGQALLRVTEGAWRRFRNHEVAGMQKKNSLGCFC